MKERTNRSSSTHDCVMRAQDHDWTCMKARRSEHENIFWRNTFLGREKGQFEEEDDEWFILDWRKRIVSKFVSFFAYSLGRTRERESRVMDTLNEWS